jgi:uncharacterized membrane protein YphA (DoxX/SURF4 family)
MRFRYPLAMVASVLLGLVLITSGLGVVTGHTAFLLNISQTYLIPNSVAHFIASFFPWAELVLGILLLLGVLSQLAALASAVLFAALLFHNTWMVAHGFSYKP